MPDANKPDRNPEELVRLTCSVHLTLQRTGPDGPVGPSECIRVPEILTRRLADFWVREGVISPDCIAPLDLTHPLP